jgi:FkbM family methyltransferase
MAAAGMNVYAFEPVPMNFSRFEKNVELNPEQGRRIELTRAAVGAAPGVLPFLVNRRSPGTCKIGTAADVTADDELIEVPVITLDGFCSERGLGTAAHTIPFLKIDVEGFELGVVQGARNLLDRRAISFIYLEVIHAAFANAGYSAGDLYDYLASAGYQAVRSSPGEFGVPIPREVFANRDAEGTRNVLFRPL